MTGPAYTGNYKVRDINVYGNRDVSIDENRRPFPQVNGFRKWVRSELDRRRREWPTPTVAPFVRMTSCNEDKRNNYKYFSLGLHGFDDNDSNIFDATHGRQRDIVGYAYNGNGRKVLIGADQITYIPPDIDSYNSGSLYEQSSVNQRVNAAQTQQSNTSADGAHPVPGITGIEIKRSGLQNPFQAIVHWQCYNQQQLEFLRNHFLIAGSYIVVEWGQKTSNSKNTNSTYLDFGNPDIMSDLVDTVVKGRTHVIDKYIAPNLGSYDYIVGQVGNFTVDLDPALNIYKCSTNIVSMGENMWGMALDSTSTIISADDDTDVSRPVDVHSYFTPGGGYDSLLDKLQKDLTGTKYVRPPTNPTWNNENPASSGTLAALAEMGANPGDDRFISWTTFTRDVMDGIIEMFNGAYSSGNTDEDIQIQSMYDKLRADLTALLGLGGPPHQNVSEEQQRLYKLEWVGNHPLLRSIDPNTMIIITSQLYPIADKVWQNGGQFGDEVLADGSAAPPYLGKLTKGVWLNVEMVRRSFLDSTTLQQALRNILSKMNVASGHYWQLQLYYDDEIGVYKVIDYKFDHDTDIVPMYVFNSNKNDHHNETVDIKFDTAFPPELVTQMMVVSMIRTMTPSEQVNLFKRYPLINNTSPFMFAVNWTSLEDVLKRELGKKRESMNIVTPSQRTKTITAGHNDTQMNSVPLSARVGDINNVAPMTGNSPSSAQNEGTSRTYVGSPPTTPSRNSKTDTAPAPNTTAFPPSPSEEFHISSYPLTPPIATSKFGARGATAAQGSRIHGGIDLKAAQGTSVYAVAAGTVVSAGVGSSGLSIISIQHTPSYVSRYLHMSKIQVSPGQKVSSGQLIGLSGGTPGTYGAGKDLSTGPHLHFEIRRNGIAQDPQKYLNDLARRDASLPAIYSGLYDGNSLGMAHDNNTSDAMTTTKSPRAATKQEQEIADRASAYARKFGNNMLALIWLNPADMRNQITKHGYQNINNKLVNAFVSPFPTKTSVEIKIPGISGISISDAFMVDKLPFIFANYGAFQTTGVTDSISVNGWYTTIRGYFKMMWPDGTGGTRVD